jgi:hypothetical protein
MEHPRRESMSTKVSIKWRHRTEGKAGFHLYDDVLDEFLFDGNDGAAAEEGAAAPAEPPVYLRLDGVAVEVQTLSTGGASVTVTIPRATARELGLLPPIDSSPPAGLTAPGSGEPSPES